MNSKSDTHVCNNLSRFTLERVASKKDVIIVKKTTHQIEVFDIINIVAKSPNDLIFIQLLNIALITNYFINLICLDRLEQKSVFYDFKNGQLQQKNKTFCYVDRVSNHKIIKYNPLSQNPEAVKSFGAFVSSSIASQILQAIEAEWHAMLRHLDFDILSYLENLAENIKVISLESALSVNKCEVCSLIKAHKLISKKLNYEETRD